MNQLSNLTIFGSRTLDLQNSASHGGEPKEEALANACIAAIDDAVENLRRLSHPSAEAPAPIEEEKAMREPQVAEPTNGQDFAEIKKTPWQETLTQLASLSHEPPRASFPERASQEATIEQTLAPTAPVVAVVETAPEIVEAAPVSEAKAPEEPAMRTAPSEPTARDELKTRSPVILPPTIDNNPGPIAENERRVRTGGGGNDNDNDGTGKGGGGGGGGGEGNVFHKRSGPVNFATSLQNGIAAVRRNMMIVMIFTVAINVLVLAIPLYLFQISDRVLTSRSIDTLIMLTVAVLGAILLQVIMDSIRRFILTRTAVELEVQLGAPILSAAARASLHGSGKDYQILQDLQQLRTFITSGTLIAFLDAPLMPLFVLVVYCVHPHLGVIIMVCCGVLFFIAYLNQKMTAKQFGEANAYLNRANFHLDSMSRNSQIINALAMIPEAVKMWGRETAGSLKSQVSAQDKNIVFSGLSKACRLITQVVLLGWGAHLSLSGQLTGGMVIAASIVSGRALAPVEGAIEGWNQFNHSRAAYGRIKQLLLSSPLNFPRLRLPNPEGRLDVERILFVPPPQKRVILNGISFSLKKGESLAVIGNSGSGKTTLGKMLVGSILPTSGNVRLDLMDLRNWDQRQFGESIGYLPQDVQLFPGTIKANICRMRDDVEDRMIYEAAVLADVHELIATFPQGYETVVTADGSPLSGGQKQRIALARAFFGDPKFVVLDEPNSNLDSNGEAALARALIHAKKQGITTVTITQRPALLQCVDKILVLKDGSVAMFGERVEVLAALKGKSNGNNGQELPRLQG